MKIISWLMNRPSGVVAVYGLGILLSGYMMEAPSLGGDLFILAGAIIALEFNKIVLDSVPTHPHNNEDDLSKKGEGIWRPRAPHQDDDFTRTKD